MFAGMLNIHIGIDSTDSLMGGCTTYVAGIIIEKLQNYRFLDYPNLIRLNPNIPIKTRGNAAICLRIKAEKKDVDEIKDVVLRVVERNRQEDSSPGIVIFSCRAKLPKSLRIYAKRAVKDVVTFRLLEKLENKLKNLEIISKGLGALGATAAIGNMLDGDYTYEILVYRKSKRRKRKVDRNSVIKMDMALRGFVFDNIDERGNLLITPHGYDPVLAGIRGEYAWAVKKAFKMVKFFEKIDRWAIFRTNQATDEHLEFRKVSSIRPYQSAIVEGVVKSVEILQGGHVKIVVDDNTGCLDCVAYKKTGLHEVARLLVEGDYIRAYGGIRPATSTRRLTLNIEKIKIIGLKDLFKLRNPKCPYCNKSLSSLGKNKGYRCKKCRRIFKKAKPIRVRVERKIRKGLYECLPSARRHLAKPLVRYGKEKIKPPKNIIKFWGVGYE